MNNVFSRPLFRSKFIQRFAEGGIVSTVVGPEEEDPMAILSNVAMQVDATEKNLDSAESIDDILTSFQGSPKTAQDARAELAEVVGQADAEATPESVLALVQPTMAILEMSRQMSPPGGIASMPMEQPTAQVPQNNFAMGPEGAPVPAFAVGGEIDYNAIMQDYANMQKSIPAGYGSDPSGAWLALAQLGAGMAQGRTFAEGLSKGTQMAGPYMQQAIESKNQQRNALSQFVASEAARRSNLSAEEKAREDQQAFQSQLQKESLAAQSQENALNRNFQAETNLENLRARRYEFDTQWERDKIKLEMQAESELKQKLLEAKTEAEKIRAQQEFEIQKLDIGHKFDLQKIEFESQFKNLETSAAERMIDEVMKGSGLDPKSKEYNDMKMSLLREQLSKSDGTTINLEGKGDTEILKNQFNSETKYLETLRTNATAAATTKNALAPVITMLQPVREGKQPGFFTGGFAAPRLQAGQALTAVDNLFGLGIGSDSINKLVGGDPAAAEVLRANMARLRTGMSEALSRVTNLQLTVLEDQLPNLAMTPQGNLIIAEMLNRTADRDLKLFEYAQKLERTYGGTINPANKPTDYRDKILQGAGVANFNGYETGKPFDENGKPIMSVDEYKMFLDKTEPLLTAEESAQLKRFSETAGSNSWAANMPNIPQQANPNQPLTWETDPNNVPGTMFFEGGKYWLRTQNGRVPAPTPTGGR